MEQLVAQFPKQIADAIDIALKSSLSLDGTKKFDHVVICGMGGSGMGGQMVCKLFASQSTIPIVLVQNYELPAFVNENTLVIGSSYSGTTEETISALNEAMKRKSTIVGISSGGDLMQLCKDNHFDFIRLPGGNPPRTMLAFSLIQLIYILSKTKIIDEEAIENAKNCRYLLNTELISIKKEARNLAKHLFKKQGVLYSDVDSEPVLIRAQQQFNENSKQLIWHNVVPEMNHNELVGWGGGNDHYSVVFFESQFLSPRTQLRIELSKEIIQGKTPNILTIHGKGKSLMEEYFYFVHIVDWASLFLAELNQSDPFEIKVIDYLKSALKKA